MLGARDLREALLELVGARAARQPAAASVSVTAAISSSPMAGGWKERKVLRLDSSFDIGRLEAYESRGAIGPRERVRLGIAGGEDEAGAVGPPLEAAELEAGPAVDAGVDDPVDLRGLLEPGHGFEHALGRDEEADARAAGRIGSSGPPISGSPPSAAASARPFRS